MVSGASRSALGAMGMSAWAAWAAWAALAAGVGLVVAGFAYRLSWWPSEHGHRQLRFAGKVGWTRAVITDALLRGDVYVRRLMSEDSRVLAFARGGGVRGETRHGK